MLDKMHLKECIEQIDQIQRLIDQLMKLPSSNPENTSKLSKCKIILTGHKSDLSTAIIKGIIKDISIDSKAPGQKIKTVTHKVENAINDLQKINKVLGVLTGLVDIFGTIVAAVSGGISVATIGSLLNELERTSAEF